jgi:hypothetical protein
MRTQPALLQGVGRGEQNVGLPHAPPTPHISHCMRTNASKRPRVWRVWQARSCTSCGNCCARRDRLSTAALHRQRGRLRRRGMRRAQTAHGPTRLRARRVRARPFPTPDQGSGGEGGGGGGVHWSRAATSSSWASPRATPDRHHAAQRDHFIPHLLRDSVAVFLWRQSGRTLASPAFLEASLRNANRTRLEIAGQAQASEGCSVKNAGPSHANLGQPCETHLSLACASRTIATASAACPGAAAARQAAARHRVAGGWFQEDPRN